jgi:hypothetical protein
MSKHWLSTYMAPFWCQIFLVLIQQNTAYNFKNRNSLLEIKVHLNKTPSYTEHSTSKVLLWASLHTDEYVSGCYIFFQALPAWMVVLQAAWQISLTCIFSLEKTCKSIRSTPDLPKESDSEIIPIKKPGLLVRSVSTYHCELTQDELLSPLWVESISPLMVQS